ncbi:MAG TPA: hypothetical protein V6D03_08210 [Candidatus Caenarcaniphilales bacterium]
MPATGRAYVIIGSCSSVEPLRTAQAAIALVQSRGISLTQSLQQIPVNAGVVGASLFTDISSAIISCLTPFWSNHFLPLPVHPFGGKFTGASIVD